MIALEETAIKRKTMILLMIAQWLRKGQGFQTKRSSEDLQLGGSWYKIYNSTWYLDLLCVCEEVVKAIDTCCIIIYHIQIYNMYLNMY